VEKKDSIHLSAARLMFFDCCLAQTTLANKKEQWHMPGPVGQQAAWLHPVSPLLQYHSVLVSQCTAIFYIERSLVQKKMVVTFFFDGISILWSRIWPGM